MIRINVGGRVFEATERTWATSEVIAMLLARRLDVVVVDRSPAMFEHVLDWMRQRRIYLDCPTHAQYAQLCDDADYYGLTDLQEFLANRVNLCRGVYLDALDGRFYCNLDRFRELRWSDCLIRDILEGRVDFTTPDTIVVPYELALFKHVLASPQTARRWTFSCGNVVSTGLCVFGPSVYIDEQTGHCKYQPVPRED